MFVVSHSTSKIEIKLYVCIGWMRGGKNKASNVTKFLE